MLNTTEIFHARIYSWLDGDPYFSTLILHVSSILCTDTTKTSMTITDHSLSIIRSGLIKDEATGITGSTHILEEDFLSSCSTLHIILLCHAQCASHLDNVIQSSTLPTGSMAGVVYDKTIVPLCTPCLCRKDSATQLDASKVKAWENSHRPLQPVVAWLINLLVGKFLAVH